MGGFRRGVESDACARERAAAARGQRRIVAVVVCGGSRRIAAGSRRENGAGCESLAAAASQVGKDSGAGGARHDFSSRTTGQGRSTAAAALATVCPSDGAGAMPRHGPRVVALECRAQVPGSPQIDLIAGSRFCRIEAHLAAAAA